MKKGVSGFIRDLILGAGVIMLIGYMFDSVYVKDFSVAFLVALVLSLLNTFIKPILTFIALPITILTLGIFQLFINGFILYIATSVLAPDFVISSYKMMIITSVVISILYSMLHIGKTDD